MGNEFKGKTSHSAEYFGDTRDHWWNADFLRLMAERWQLDAVRSVLDVGCGVGHWGALLANLLPIDAHVTGIDRDPFWVEKATERATARGSSARISFRVGEASLIPFDDDTFDLTTCQTVLIHVPDPAAALKEMIRVTKPGGLVAVAEPNNLAYALVFDSLSAKAPIDDVVSLVRLQLTCERGKAALGLGDNSVGDLLPGIFGAEGLLDLSVHQSDKAFAVLPPYARDDERAFVEEANDHVARSFWWWDHDETKRYFLGGGGTEAAFGPLWELALRSRVRNANALSAGTFATAGGSICYLIAGRKPRP